MSTIKSNGTSTTETTPLKEKDHKDDAVEPIQCSRDDANIISKLFFFYLGSIIAVCHKRLVTHQDIPKLENSDSCQSIASRFEISWLESLKSFYTGETPKHLTDASKVDESQRPSLWMILGRMNFLRLFFSFTMECIRCTATVAVPVVLQKLVKQISILQALKQLGAPVPDTYEYKEWYLYILVVIMFLCTAIATVCLNLSMAIAFKVGVHIQSAIVGGTFRKSLRLSSAAQANTGLGYILNMCGHDATRSVFFVPYIQNVWSSPAQMIVIFVLIGQLLGWKSTLPAAGVLIITLILMKYFHDKIHAIEKKKMEIADKRIKLLQEAMAGIKVVKTYAWEGPFAVQMAKLRKEELRYIFKWSLYRGGLFVSFLVSPMLMAIVCFFTYVGTGNSLHDNTSAVFGTLALINLLRLPLLQMPMIMTMYTAAAISMKRVANFRMLEEDEPLKNNDDLPKGQIEIEGNFTWTEVEGNKKEGSNEFGYNTDKIYTEQEWCYQLQEWLGQDLSIEDAQSYAKRLVAAKALSLEDLIKMKKRKIRKLGLPKSHSSRMLTSARDLSAARSRQSLLNLKKLEEEAELNGETKRKEIAVKIPFSLKNLKLKIKPGQLVEVIGAVGSGKSSLISAIIGCMQTKDGKASLNGNIAYVPQKAWIRNLTFKQNIVFGKPYDKEKYEEILRVCALTYDRELLISGDDTEIGEKGINLSGGQKQRVSLARAIYSESDIYLLDDPLSAVDQDTGKHIFYQCLIPYLKKKGKTVILVTHQVQFLEPADRILIMNDGTIIHDGSYDELKDLEIMSTFGQVAEEKEKKKDAPPGEAKSGDGSIVEKEKIAVGTVPRDVYVWYVRTMGGLTFFLSCVFFYSISQAALIAADWWLSAWTGQKYNYSANQYMAVYGGLGGLGAVTAFVRIWIYARGTRMGAAVIHDSIVDRVIAATMRYFDTTPSGRIVDILSKDQQYVDALLPIMYDSYIVMLLTVLGSLILVGIVTRWFFIPFVVLAGLYVYYRERFLPASRAVQRLWLTAQSPIISHLAESIQGADSIRACRMEETYITENNSKVDSLNKSFYVSQTLARWLDIRLSLIAAFVILVTGIIVLLIRNQLTAATAGLALTYSVSITGYLSSMVLYSSFAETFMTAVQRMKYTAFNTPIEKYKGTKHVPRDWPQSPSIEFENVVFRYHEGGPVILNKVNFTVPAKCKVGIVGRTGAGKSTITISLFRIVELSEGSIKIDGVDISQLDLYDLRSRLAIIPQDPVLFDGTVRFNLDPFGNYEDADVWKALEIAQLKSAILKLEGGLSGHVLAGGANFSVGQRQLFCLARALLRRAKILIMDEATASVDPATDELIQKMIRAHFSECTVLTIAHRLNTIADSDRILVLANGQVAEYDSPQALLQNPDSLYSKLMHSNHDETPTPSVLPRSQQSFAVPVPGAISPYDSSVSAKTIDGDGEEEKEVRFWSGKPQRPGGENNIYNN